MITDEQLEALERECRPTVCERCAALLPCAEAPTGARACICCLNTGKGEPNYVKPATVLELVAEVRRLRRILEAANGDSDHLYELPLEEQVACLEVERMNAERDRDAAERELRLAREVVDAARRAGVLRMQVEAYDAAVSK